MQLQPQQEHQGQQEEQGEDQGQDQQRPQLGVGDEEDLRAQSQMLESMRTRNRTHPQGMPLADQRQQQPIAPKQPDTHMATPQLLPQTFADYKKHQECLQRILRFLASVQDADIDSDASERQPAEGLAVQPPQPDIHPTPAQQQASVALVEKLKIECKESALFANRLLHDIPDAQWLEYLSDFERLQRLITELDHELPHYACVMEDAIRKLVLMVLGVQQQRELLSSGVPKCFLPLSAIKGMMQQVQSAAEAFETFAISTQHFDVASSSAQLASEGSGQVQEI